ncbi:extensin family protein [Bradyrhizobium sp. BWA-3-5]|uniref:extensin family protein n=1 Tax=Bradyrhizobium sp. BWA-3-5 TaxID=3080013 RepID=UPI00293E1B2E|nr:extensin family protein [Bradyrhizobium sp. BWA-3-5]WOH64842.1 extensin family protein [Bradyrhizobium sp. BWA-3-5]
MNFTARKASRKWANGAFGRIGAAMVTAAAGALLVGMPADPALAAKASRAAPWDGLFSHLEPRARAKSRHAVVPLPKPRPDEAPSAERDEETDKDQAPLETDKTKDKAKEQAAPAPQPTPQPSACRLALTDDIAIAPSIPDIRGANGCGGEDLVRLEAVVLPDKRRVSVKPAAILRCTMASAIAGWIRSDIAPLAQRLGGAVAELDNFDSFECRGRNRIVGAKLSEHGRANALDVRGFKLADGTLISLTDRTVPRQLRETVLHSVCARFSTVLGPSSDWYHEDHIHLDLMERRGNYRICQWDVLDPLPQKAPLLPAERPEEAPPREVAAKADHAKPEDAKPSAGKPEAEKSDAENPDAEKSEQTEPPREEKPAKKKRRQSRRS